MKIWYVEVQDEYGNCLVHVRNNNSDVTSYFNLIKVLTVANIDYLQNGKHFSEFSINIFPTPQLSRLRIFGEQQEKH